MIKQSSATSQPKKVLVVGLGISGQAVTELLLRQGIAVTATDLHDEPHFAASLGRLQDLGGELHLGAHRVRDFLEVEQIIVSPGVPLDLEPLRRAAAQEIEIIGELEWAWRQTRAPVVAITGTNGKTTTTSLLGEILRVAGKRVFVGGNIGTPLSQWLLGGQSADLLVLEVSSFQLDTAPTFRPEVGILLNITEDHLDRYADFSDYAESKLAVFRRQRSDDVAIVNGDDPQCRQRLWQVPSRLMTFSRQFSEAQAFIGNDRLTVHLGETEPLQFDLSAYPLRGPHNAENIAAAVLAATVLGVAESVCHEVLSQYHGLPHRVEWVACRRGIDFYDDSKATNVGAVVKALDNFHRPVLLLAGGRDKYGAYQPLVTPLREKAKGLFLFGQAAPRMHQELAGVIPTHLAKDLTEAFGQALAQACPGDIVLLSPACSSFDQYESYAQRGDHFKRLVSDLSDRKEAGCRT
jgi:UDP-N-acetylmuramoylalanine--D-glutamate ligase